MADEMILVRQSQIAIAQRSTEFRDLQLAMIAAILQQNWTGARQALDQLEAFEEPGQGPAATLST